MIMNHQYNHHPPLLRMMMQMIFMIHHHLQGLAEICADLSGINKLLSTKAAIHLLQFLHMAEAVAKVQCLLLEVVVLVTQIVMVMELIMAMDMDKGLQDIHMVMAMAVVAKPGVEDCITITVHSCSLIMMKWNILISSLVL